jgi:hypothetical protein
MNMNVKRWMLIVGAVLAAGGCQSKNYLTERYNLPRADLKDDPIEVTHEPAPVTAGETVNEEPTAQTPPAVPGTVDVITGTWDFSVPPTVTRVERKSADLQQFSLYNGRPAPADKPFVVITIAPSESDKGSLAEADPDKYKISNTRSYALNGNIAKEWTGRTSDGSAYCELIITKPGGTGDLCHAIGVAKSADERKLALDILGSITWKPTP